jgi:hypothetical protein
MEIGEMEEMKGGWRGDTIGLTISNTALLTQHRDNTEATSAKSTAEFNIIA